MRRSALLAALLVLTLAVAVAYAQQPAPTVATGAATSVKQNSVVLNGTVTPNGADSTWYFAYGTTTAYGQKTATKTVTAGQGAEGRVGQRLRARLGYGLPLQARGRQLRAASPRASTRPLRRRAPPPRS